MVQTLRGPVAAEQLGFTYVHEHVLTQPPAWRAAEDPDYVLDDAEASLACAPPSRPRAASWRPGEGGSRGINHLEA